MGDSLLGAGWVACADAALLAAFVADARHAVLAAAMCCASAAAASSSALTLTLSFLLFVLPNCSGTVS